MSKAKEMTAAQAIKEVKGFEKVGELRKFATGETRKSVLDAVNSQVIKIKNTKPKKAAKKETKPAKITPSR